VATNFNTVIEKSFELETTVYRARTYTRPTIEWWCNRAGRHLRNWQWLDARPRCGGIAGKSLMSDCDNEVDHGT